MEITTMTLEEAEKIGYVAKLQGYDIYTSDKKLYSELQSVWSTYSDEVRDNWAMIQWSYGCDGWGRREIKYY